MGILRTDKISGLETPTAVTGSVVFDGTGDYLSIASSSDFTFETGDFTVELYVNATNFTNRGTFYDSRAVGGTTGITIGHEASTGELRVYMNATSGSDITAQSTDFTTDTWYHVAVTRSSGTVRLFIDGILKDSGTRTSDMNNTNAVNIGYKTYDSSSYDYFSGYVSNFRILRGTALYTSEFTPPVHALEVIGDTVLLCCNNPDSAGAASYAGIGTSKTITVNGDAAASTVSPSLTRDFTSGTEFRGVTVFDTQGYFVPPSGTTEQRGRGRGLFGGGRAYPGNSIQKTIDFVEIQTQGNALDFGDLTSIRERLSGAAGAIRGLFAGGQVSPTTNIIDFVTISTTSNATDFGDLTTPRMDIGGAANHTRAVFFAGGTPGNNSNIIDFVTIASIGNAVNFGELTDESLKGCGCGSPTRGIIFIGTTVQYITWATTGNAQDFGDTTITNTSRMALSDSTRGIVAGGYASPAKSNVIEYITIATLGNAQDFGDLTYGAYEPEGASSNSTRGVLALGDALVLSETNAIDYITIQTTGNAKDFGDLTQRRKQGAACSDSHGGIA